MFPQPAFSQLCTLWQLGNLTAQPIAITNGRLWRIATTQGIFAVKQLSVQSPAYQNIEQGEAIAQLFMQQKLPVIAALLQNGKFIHEFDGQHYLLFPWCSGKTLSFEAVSAYHAMTIGKLLANLHQAHINRPNTYSAVWQNFQPMDWKGLVNKNVLSKLEHWSELYFAACEKLLGANVISHGDLTQANIIWDATDKPWLIDWESAGWLHPQVELLGVALNWSGINVTKPAPDIFKAVLAGYQQAGGNVLFNQTIFQAGLGSWLAWLAFNLRCFVSTQADVFRLEADKTIVVLERIDKLSLQF